jgi:hypothetical protein
VASRAMKIYDRPVIFALLNMSHLKRYGLVTTQADM